MKIFKCNPLVIIFLLFFIYSCKNETKKKQNQNLVDRNIEQQFKQDDSLKSKIILPLTVEEVSLNSIKKRFLEFYTSGKLSSRECLNYKPKKQIEFYGVYYFTHSNRQIPLAGKAIVACQEQDGWDYLNLLEEVVEFTTYSNELNPFIEFVQIGQTKKDVTQNLSNDFNEVENNLTYTDKEGNVVKILLNTDTVVAIQVGRYKNINEVSSIRLKW